jgi:hypothetical protein
MNNAIKEAMVFYYAMYSKNEGDITEKACFKSLTRYLKIRLFCKVSVSKTYYQ